MIQHMNSQVEQKELERCSRATIWNSRELTEICTVGRESTGELPTLPNKPDQLQRDYPHFKFQDLDI